MCPSISGNALLSKAEKRSATSLRAHQCALAKEVMCCNEQSGALSRHILMMTRSKTCHQTAQSGARLHSMHLMSLRCAMHVQVLSRGASL